MHTRLTLPNGDLSTVVVRENAEKFLSKKCFRPATERCAGNFLKWRRAENMFADRSFTRRFVIPLQEVWLRRSLGTNRCNIEYGSPVGWTSTDGREKYEAAALEPFKPNYHSDGLRVKTSRTDLLAPQTCLVTVVFEAKIEHGRPVFIIHTTYPGADVGELRGDLSTRNNCVFFDWSHPGAPDPV